MPHCCPIELSFTGTKVCLHSGHVSNFTFIRSILGVSIFFLEDGKGSKPGIMANIVCTNSTKSNQLVITGYRCT